MRVALRHMSGTWFVWNMDEVEEEEIRGSKVLAFVYVHGTSA